jgi:hypothetical protein
MRHYHHSAPANANAGPRRCTLEKFGAQSATLTRGSGDPYTLRLMHPENASLSRPRLCWRHLAHQRDVRRRGCLPVTYIGLYGDSTPLGRAASKISTIHAVTEAATRHNIWPPPPYCRFSLSTCASHHLAIFRISKRLRLSEGRLRAPEANTATC